MKLTNTRPGPNVE